MLCLADGLVACTTQEVKPNGTGGKGGTSASTGGNGGPGGGGGSQGATNDGIACLPPGQMITDFTYNPDGGSTTQVPFGTFGTTLSGGESAYGSFTGDVTGNDWHIMGNVADYSGFNFYFDTTVPAVLGCNKFDASAFKGITFTIWGTVSGNPLTMGMATLDDAVAYSWLNSVDAGTATQVPGRCFPTSGNGPYYHPGCADPTYAINVTGTQASPQTVTALWSDFTGGLPTAGVTPTSILSVYWNTPWMPPAASYAVDIHIDNLAFIP